MGRKLEEKVGEIYRLLGASKIIVNTSLNNFQVDLYVEIGTIDGYIARYGIDCKNYSSNVGVAELASSASKLCLLRQNNYIDFPVIIAQTGFTADAKSCALQSGVRALTVSDLLNSLIDFTNYLQNEIGKYETSSIYLKDIYRNLKCRSDEDTNLGFIDDYVTGWINNGSNFLTILGDYGAGKTTFARRLFWRMAKNYLTERKGRLPIYIPLMKYWKVVSIRSLITDLLLHDYGIKMTSYNVFKQINEEGNILLIFDAFDEMAAGADEKDIINNFKEIKSLVSDNTKIILTCRTHYFKDQDQIYKVHEGTQLYNEILLDKNRYTICYLSAFTKEDVEFLIEKYDPVKKDSYLQLIETTHNLGELSRHPILLDMILKTLPEFLRSSSITTPADLYGIYTSDWLNRDDWRSQVPHEMREYFMKELAFYFLSNGMTSIHYRNLPHHIKRKFPGLRTYKEQDIFDSDIRTCTFLHRDPKGNYSFVHRSFSEYFAALRASEMILEGNWPGDTSSTKSPNEWITPETAQFAIDIIYRANNAFNIVIDHLLTSNNGYLLFHILLIFAHANQNDEIKKQMKTIIRERFNKNGLTGLPYRSCIRNAVYDKVFSKKKAKPME